jgi:uncharacterized repeat protein (TIGR03803 family)
MWLAAPCGRAATHYQTLKSFGFPDQVGAQPWAALIEASDGALYGTTYGSGTNDAGTVFRINLDGTGYKVLHAFDVGGGGNPWAGLLEGRDGALYGTTYLGQVFKLNKDGTGYTVLHQFGGLDGQNPEGALIQGIDGALYGTTYNGGSVNLGTVFKLQTDGSGFTVLHSFTHMVGDGNGPKGALLLASDGALYGTTELAGTSNRGTIFRLSTDGSGFTLLRSFTGTALADGQFPHCPLVEGSDGALYGTTSSGGSNNWGTVFKIGKDGTGYSVLCHFGYNSSPHGGLVMGKDGALYGTTYSGGTFVNSGSVFKLNQDGSGYAVFSWFDFRDPNAYGQHPIGLVQGTNGVFYGTTSGGGAYNAGTIFQFNSDGSGYAILRSFIGLLNGGDGQNPEAAVIEAGDGALYGTMSAGGPASAGGVFELHKDGSGYAVLRNFGVTSGRPGPGLLGLQLSQAPLVQAPSGALYGTAAEGGSLGWGALFKLNTNGGSYNVTALGTTLGSTGSNPRAGLLLGSDGLLYGTTFAGGSANAGTVFSWNPVSNVCTDLLDFGTSPGDAANPRAALVEGDDGALYGTTYAGGASNLGAVFKVGKDGTGYTVLYSFGRDDGASPQAGLVLGSDRALYGTSSAGGSNNLGTIFKLSQDGSNYTVLHHFGAAGDGASPQAGLVIGKDGALYGTTFAGGASNLGTIFKLDQDGGGYSILHNFTGAGTDGSQPQAALLLGTDGLFYGTTSQGGGSGLGAVFKLWPPQTPDLLGVSNAVNGLQVTFAGTGGARYQVLRSTDLSNWSVLDTITMPLAGSYTHQDSAAPASAAYYRAAWVP